MTNLSVIDFKRLFFLLLILIPAYCFSQDQGNAEVTDVTKATILPPGISYEKKIGRVQTLYAQAFMNITFAIGYSSSFGTTSSINFDPALTLQYRYYYNSGTREAKGKRTEMNSLNYVGAISQTDFAKEIIYTPTSSEKRGRTIYTFGIVWGMQRNYERRFSLDLNLGPGFYSTKTHTVDNRGQFITENIVQPTLVIEFNLGFWLNKGK